MKLRSIFEPGTTRWAVRRAQWLAMGLTENDFDKPKIAIVNSSSGLSVCYQHLDELSRIVQQGVREAGGVPFEIRTVAPSDFITSAGLQARYLMPSRDLLANDIEVQVEGACLDGMVLLASCDKTTPGQIMAVGRLNIPSILVTCGYQLGGACGGKSVDIEDLYKAIGTLKAGRISLEELKKMSCVAIKGPGVCAGLATANSMHIMAEALGLTLPGNAPIRAGGKKLELYAREAGKQIISLVTNDIRPRQILTPSAFRNAIKVAISIGASVNCVRHLTASAIEAECPIDVIKEFEQLASTVPQITQVRPNGPDRIEDLDSAGGCRGVQLRLSSMLDTSVMTASGRTLAKNLAEAPQPEEKIIRTLERPFRDEPGLIVIRGNLAPDGAIVKLSAVPKEVRQFQGPARIFETEDEAIAGLQNGRVQSGDVIILRGLGPKGGPGTVFAASFMAALVGAGFGSSVAVVTDGELSGLNSGITIGQVMPEAAEGGPLAMIRENETIHIDLTQRKIDVQISESELQQRLQTWSAPIKQIRPGWLAQYHQLVQPLSQGAVLGKRELKKTI